MLRWTVSGTASGESIGTLAMKLATGYADKCCMIEVRSDGHQPIAVTHRETTLDQVIHARSIV